MKNYYSFYKKIENSKVIPKELKNKFFLFKNLLVFYEKSIDYKNELYNNNSWKQKAVINIYILELASYIVKQKNQEKHDLNNDEVNHLIKTLEKVFDIDKEEIDIDTCLDKLSILDKSLENVTISYDSETIFFDTIDSYKNFKNNFRNIDDDVINKYSIFFNSLFSASFPGLSSGQLALFNLMSRLYSLKKETKLKDSILIMIDEVDLYLHPQWQKQILSSFIKLFNSEFKDKKIQLLMTTNNAIPVSDILRYNVTLLGDNKKQNFENYRNTFGGNIFNLLNDTFFIQDGFIGEFAQIKIQELIDILYEKDTTYLVEHMDEIVTRINLIGEDLIKNKLLEILEQRLKANLFSIKNNLDKLEERLSKLEQRNNHNL
ncbi:AAA family ATPase [Myroides odoratimimus]|uniref:AAA family ATPase n=1 Tax=Myroides odoratimimus TaxID=76832 RepID=UPI002578FE66|nr:AAA family ATPase [Myroides odoratimimus]